jgi:cytochrome c-type biogenesis protein CcmH/NrfG
VPGTAAVALMCAGYVAGRGPAGVPGPQRTRPVQARVATAGALIVVSLVALWAVWQPQRSQSSSEAALAALADRRPGDARMHALAAHDRDPVALRPLFDLAAIEDVAGRKPQAQQALERAVKLQPANPSSWSQLASYQLHTLNQPTVAFQTARAALFLDPKSPTAQALFIETYRRLPRRPVRPGQGGRPGVGGVIGAITGQGARNSPGG